MFYFINEPDVLSYICSFTVHGLLRGMFRLAICFPNESKRKFSLSVLNRECLNEYLASPQLLPRLPLCISACAHLSTMTTLPTRDEFFTNGLSLLDTCNICLEAFDHTHIAVRFTGPDACCHVFGKECLQQWLLSDSENANKCPTCRRPLFHGDEEEEVDVSLEDDARPERSGGYEAQEGISYIFLGNPNYEGEITDDLSGERPEEDVNEEAALGNEAETMESQVDAWLAMNSDENQNEVTYNTSGDNAYENEYNDDGNDEEGGEDNARFPSDLKDISNPEHAYKSVESLVARAKASGGQQRRTHRGLRILVSETCEHLGIEALPARRSREWHQMCLLIGRLDQVVTLDISENELRRIWVPQMVEALDWQLSGN